jgi:hypothetical protein
MVKPRKTALEGGEAMPTIIAAQPGYELVSWRMCGDWETSEGIDPNHLQYVIAWKRISSRDSNEYHASIPILGWVVEDSAGLRPLTLHGVFQNTDAFHFGVKHPDGCVTAIIPNDAESPIEYALVCRDTDEWLACVREIWELEDEDQRADLYQRLGMKPPEPKGDQE